MAVILITDYLFVHVLFSIWSTCWRKLQQGFSSKKFLQLLEQIWTRFIGKYWDIYLCTTSLTASFFINISETRPDFSVSLSREKRTNNQRWKRQLKRPISDRETPLVTVHPPQLIFHRGDATLSPSCLFHISGVTPSLSPSPSLQLSLARA